MSSVIFTVHSGTEFDASVVIKIASSVSCHIFFPSIQLPATIKFTSKPLFCKSFCMIMENLCVVPPILLGAIKSNAFTGAIEIIANNIANTKFFIVFILLSSQRLLY